MAEIQRQTTIHEALQKVRYELSKTELKKSGYNAYAKFNYFELKDFLPTATKLFYENGICPVFQIAVGSNGTEYAILTLIKDSETVEFKVPTAEPNNSNNPIQNQGSKITYMRRYVYSMALDLVENDVIDAVAGKEDKPAINLATKFQIDKISQNKEMLIDKFKEMNIKTMNDIKALTVEQASELLKILEERLMNAD